MQLTTSRNDDLKGASAAERLVTSTREPLLPVSGLRPAATAHRPRGSLLHLRGWTTEDTRRGQTFPRVSLQVALQLRFVCNCHGRGCKKPRVDTSRTGKLSAAHLRLCVGGAWRKCPSHRPENVLRTKTNVAGA